MTEIKDNEIENEEGKKKSKKRFHWIKLPKDFFARRKIKRLKASKNAHASVNRYIGLLLASVETDGIIQLYGGFETVEEEIAFTLDEEDYIDDLVEDLKLYEKLELIEYEKDEEGRTRLILSEFSTMVGQGESTKRVQEHRERKKMQEINQLKKEVEESKDDASEIELAERMEKYNKKRNSIKKTEG